MIEAGILDNRCVELLNREIVEMPPEGEPHAYFSSEAEEYLMRLLADGGQAPACANAQQFAGLSRLRFLTTPNPNPILRSYNGWGMNTWSITLILKMFSG